MVEGLEEFAFYLPILNDGLDNEVCTRDVFLIYTAGDPSEDALFLLWGEPPLLHVRFEP